MRTCRYVYVQICERARMRECMHTRIPFEKLGLFDNEVQRLTRDLANAVV